MKRAGDELGFTRDHLHELRELPEGHFFTFGPAISRAVTRGHAGPVSASHPKAGGRLPFTAPPPTERVRALLPKLADVPAEAEARHKSIEDRVHRAGAVGHAVPIEWGWSERRLAPRAQWHDRPGADNMSQEASDGRIWDEATSSGPVIVTKDEDLPARRRASVAGPAVVWIRIGNATRRETLRRFAMVFPDLVAALDRGDTLIEIV